MCLGFKIHNALGGNRAHLHRAWILVMVLFMVVIDLMCCFYKRLPALCWCLTEGLS